MAFTDFQDRSKRIAFFPINSKTFSRKWFFVIQIGASFSFFSNLHAQPDLQRQALIKSVFHQIYLEAYDSAFANCAELEALQPGDPGPYVLRASIYQAQMRNYRIRHFETIFDSLGKIAVNLADRQVKKTPTAEMYFMQGTARGLQVLYLFQQGSYAAAIREGAVALHAMRRTIEKDKSFVDPKLILGVYKYWKGRALDFGLGLQKNELKRAEKMVRDVWKNGRYLTIDAAFTLQNMFMKNKEYVRAWEMNEWLVQRYPSHPSVLYHRAALLAKLRRPGEALIFWQKLDEHIQRFPHHSGGYLTEIHYRRAAAYETLNAKSIGVEIEQLKNALKKAIFYAKTRNPAMEIDNVYQSFEEMNKEIKKLSKKYMISDEP